MKYQVTHCTKYKYWEVATLSHNMVRLRPRDHNTQQCLRHELKVSPTPATIWARLDYFGNHVMWFSLQEAHTQLSITACSEVEVNLALRPDVSQGPSWEQVRETLSASSEPQTLAVRQFSFDSSYISRAPELAAYARPSFAAGKPFLQCVLDLTERIKREFEFLPGSTTVGTPVLEVLRTRRGVCQDFAHLQIGCLRSLGFAAGYVSGYIATTPPPGQPRLAGADASHAWVGVFTPGFGWIDFDPTNGIMPTDSHVTIAWGRDYDDVGPVRGVLIGGQRQQLDVSVDIVPVSA
jgi:transglutaminase-like putative cysteine protease